MWSSWSIVLVKHCGIAWIGDGLFRCWFQSVLESGLNFEDLACDPVSLTAAGVRGSASS